MSARIKADRAEFARLAAAGATNKELAQHFGMHFGAASRLRNQLGIPSPRRRIITQEQRDQMAAMLEDGCPHAEIARTLGVDVSSIARYFPGTAWTPQQHLEHLSAINRLSGLDWNRPRKGIYRGR